MRHVLERVSEESVRLTVLTLNTFLNVESFIQCLRMKLSGWFERLLASFSIKSRFLEVEWKKNPPTLVDLLEMMSRELPDWSWLQGYDIPVPILFIDEVNKLRELVTIDPNGQKALETVFTWFVAMTKEQRKFHVMLCSSDSFMYNWLGNFIDNDRFNVYAIGHLFGIKKLPVVDFKTENH